MAGSRLKLAPVPLPGKESYSYSSQVSSVKNTLIVIHSHMNKHLAAEAAL